MSTDVYKAIGMRLKSTRESLGYTQDQVAQHLGINRVQLSYYENGKREIDMDTLIKLADLYGYSRAYFVQGGEPEPATLSLRAQEFKAEDLNTVAMVNRFAKNLSYLKSLLEGTS